MKFRRVKYPVLLALIISSLMWTGCKRTLEADDILGPDTIAAPEGFSYTSGFTITPNFGSINVPFNGDSAYFNVTFSDKVSWVISITNDMNGAQKEIVGVSDKIDATNSVWYWDSDNDEFFTRSVNFTAELTVTGFDEKLSVTKKIGTAKTFHQKTFTSDKGIEIYHVVIDDFDAGDNRNFELSPAIDGADDVAFEITNAVSGEELCMQLKGTDLSFNGWCGDLSTGNEALVNEDLKTEDPSDLYFNLLIYGSGTENTKVQLFAWEIDDETNFNDAKTGGYSLVTSLNDKWVYDVNVTWTGWKMVSVAYDEFQKANDPATGGNGNKVKEPARISAVGASLLSDPQQGSTVETYVDHYVLTQGGKFSQSSH